MGYSRSWIIVEIIIFLLLFLFQNEPIFPFVKLSFSSVIAVLLPNIFHILGLISNVLLSHYCFLGGTYLVINYPSKH